MPKRSGRKNGGGNSRQRKVLSDRVALISRSAGGSLQAAPQTSSPFVVESDSSFGTSTGGWLHQLLNWDVFGVIVPSVFGAVGLAMLAIDWFPHHLLCSQISFTTAAALTITKVIAHTRESRKGFGVKTISGILVILAGFSGLMWIIQKHKYPDPQQALTVIQPLLLQDIGVGRRPSLVVNQLNRTGKVLRIREASMVVTVSTPNNVESRNYLENTMWNVLEESYKTNGFNQDIPGRGQGLTNLRIQSSDPPLSEEAMRRIADGSVTLYFIGVTRDRETDADLVSVCAYRGTDGEVRFCGKHNNP
jgi:hypothetical protein